MNVIVMETVVIQTRIDAKLKKNAESMLSSIGMDMTSAIRLFLTQVVNQKCIPFDLVPNQERYNKETLQVFQEAENISDRKKKVVEYSTSDESFESIAAEDAAPYGDYLAKHS